MSRQPGWHSHYFKSRLSGSGPVVLCATVDAQDEDSGGCISLMSWVDRLLAKSWPVQVYARLNRK